MAQITIPCLVAKKNGDGTLRWYWQPSGMLARAGWKAMPLGRDEGAAIVAARARNDEVEAWKAGGALVNADGTPMALRRRVDRDTVSALVARYRREVIEADNPATRRKRLKPKTIEVYETSLARIEAWAGAYPLAYVTPARIRALRDTTAKPAERGGIGHAAAFNLLRMVRQLFAFAESVDLIPKGSNPATDFGLGAPAPRAQIWEAADEAAFIAAAYEFGLPSMALAIELALYSAQREGDLIAFTEAELLPLELHNQLVRERFTDAQGVVLGWCLTQLKTSASKPPTQMQIPLEPTILRKIERAIAANRARDRAAEPKRLLTYVLVDDRTGLPWKQRAFIAAWTQILEHAGEATGRPHMTDLVWHDLRRTRVVRLRRRGMDPAMIASITGHSQQSIAMMLKVYGPVDPTMTAAAIASAMDAPAAAAVAESEAGKEGRA